MTYSLRRPPAGLTGFLRLIWPLIFVQLVALKRWVRAQYGPGVPYWYGMTRWGRVYLRHLPIDFAASCAAPGALRPPPLAIALFAPSARLAAALAPEPCAVPLPVRAQRQSSVHTLSTPVRADTS
jgi:hypothetical protein